MFHHLRKGRAVLKLSWLIVVLFSAVVVAVLLYVARRKFRNGSVPRRSDVSLVETVSSRIGDVVTDVKVEAAVIGAKSEARRERLEDVRREKDGERRRAMLAEILSDSL